jgi:hypothetical protein
MRANSANSPSVSRSHIWQPAQKYSGAPPIASWRRSSRATRSGLGILKSSIALPRWWWQGEERSSWYDEVKARFGVLCSAGGRMARFLMQNRRHYYFNSKTVTISERWRLRKTATKLPGFGSVNRSS